MRARALTTLLVLAAALATAGCTADGAAGKGNFDLKPQRIGWYAGDEAHFTLEITPSLLRSEPSFTIDRRFAIEEIQLDEQGFAVGGDYETKDPDDVALRLSMDNATADEFTLDAQHPRLDLALMLPTDLRDSEYVLEIKLFQVGWIKSEPFRVDLR